jgi:signal transduction histidine kinase
MEDGVPVFVSGDAARLRLVLRNLLSNAIKYSPPESLVEVRLHMRNGQAIVSVEDQGPGIPEAYRSQIFEQYFRIPGSPPGGFGLGLYLSRQLIKAHNGAISVEEGAGGGARFVVSMPAIVADESTIGRRPARSDPLARTRSG